MAIVVELPQLGDDFREGVVLRWLVGEGDRVEPGQAIAEIEAEKATMEVESSGGGQVLKLVVEAGQVSELGSPIAVVGEPGEDPERALAQARATKAQAFQAQATAAPTTAAPTTAAPARQEQRQDSQLDTMVPHSQMRRTIVRRMQHSQQQVPHFYLSITIDMEEAAKARADYNMSIKGAKISINDILLLAAARCLRSNPRCNASYRPEGVVEHGVIMLGFAVAVEGGLVVPVLEHAEQKTLKEISIEVRDLGKRAKKRELLPEELSGSTFTVSNLGMFGLSGFAAMVNPGEGAILAVGAVEPAPAVIDDEIVIRRQIHATLSCDHRVVDGAVGAQYLASLKALLEAPKPLFG